MDFIVAYGDTNLVERRNLFPALTFVINIVSCHEMKRRSVSTIVDVVIHYLVESFYFCDVSVFGDTFVNFNFFFSGVITAAMVVSASNFVWLKL